MGWGDEIMVSSIAKRIHAMTNQLVRIVGRDGVPRKCDLWEGQPYIHEWGRAILVNGPGERHYYSKMEGTRILWRKWDIAPGEIRLTDDERKWAVEAMTDFTGTPIEDFFVCSPTFKEKGGGGANKDWGIQNWQTFSSYWLAEETAAALIEVGPKGSHVLGGAAIRVVTPTFRHACAILERSIGYVGHEGGLHHAAAALGKPAVVVFGGFISPEVTGYAGHTNLYVPDERYPLGCGDTAPCHHCRAAMDKITVEHVVSAVKEMVREGPPHTVGGHYSVVSAAGYATVIDDPGFDFKPTGINAVGEGSE